LSPHGVDFENELLRHTAMLQALARSLVRGADADDLVQETLVQGLQHARRAHHLGAYLRQVCHNLFAVSERTRLRREARERAQAVALTEPSAHETIEHRAAVRAVADAIASLDTIRAYAAPRDRHAGKHRYFGERSIDIGEQDEDREWLTVLRPE
jgi:DNA-directed RNA polymerase specialized sigma24 family protein